MIASGAQSKGQEDVESILIGCLPAMQAILSQFLEFYDRCLTRIDGSGYPARVASCRISGEWYINMLRIFFLLLVTWIVTGETSYSRAQAQPALANAAKKVKQIIGHRGSCADRPENTLASYRRAIEAGATVTEIDVRVSKDGALISLHDADVKRTTNGKGLARDLTLAELRGLDAGSWFDPKYKEERIPTMREILELARGKIDVMLDLQEKTEDYAKAVVAEVRKFGEPKRIVVGVRTLEQAKQFRVLLPEARQIGLIPTSDSIDAFAEAKVDMIRLWSKWLDDKSLVPRVRRHKLGLHLNGTVGAEDETRMLLAHEPESLASDDPARLVRTLKKIANSK
jgi:glycerophosphoryl diester phosphodiesterase